MNSTKWLTLTEFVKHLGRSGQCKVEETEKGWFITLVHRDELEVGAAGGAARAGAWPGARANRAGLRRRAHPPRQAGGALQWGLGSGRRGLVPRQREQRTRGEAGRAVCPSHRSKRRTMPRPLSRSRQEIEGAKRQKRERAEQAEEERHARMLREQIERAQKVARADGGGGGEDAGPADPAATELRRDALKDQPLGFQLAKARAAAALAAEQAAAAARPKPAAAFEEEDGGGGAGPSGRGGAAGAGGGGGGGKKSKIEELMEKVGRWGGARARRWVGGWVGGHSWQLQRHAPQAHAPGLPPQGLRSSASRAYTLVAPPLPPCTLPAAGPRGQAGAGGKRRGARGGQHTAGPLAGAGHCSQGGCSGSMCRWVAGRARVDAWVGGAGWAALERRAPAPAAGQRPRPDCASRHGSFIAFS